MSRIHEHDQTQEQPASRKRDGDAGNGGDATPASTDKVTRGDHLPEDAHHRQGHGRDGDPDDGGSTPPSTDPPPLGD
jgi:hypothetical protein